MRLKVTWPNVLIPKLVYFLPFHFLIIWLEIDLWNQIGLDLTPSFATW